MSESSAACLLLAALLAAPAVAGAQAVDTLPADAAVTIGALPNGLRYYVRENRTPAQRAELRLVVNAGSVLEDEDQRGLAHFLEHMAFNGTNHFPKHELVHYLQSVGMRFGGDLNASTSHEETVYKLTIPTDDSAIVTRGIEILEDWATGITLDSAEVEAERGVVLEEWRNRLGQQARARARNDSVVYAGSPYVDRTPIGDTTIIRRAGVAELRRFYRDWYRPDLMAVVAVGDFDGAEMVELIRRHFSRIPMPSEPRARPVVGLPSNAETVVATFTDSAAAAPGIAVLVKQPPYDRTTVASFRDDLVDRLYVNLIHRRLREVARRANPPFVRADVSEGWLLRVATFDRLSATVTGDSVEAGLAAALREVERMARHGVPPAELEREKASLLTRLSGDSISARARVSAPLAQAYVEHYLEGRPIMTADQTLALARRLLGSVTPDDVARRAQVFRDTANRVLLVTLPARAAARPTRESLLAVFDSVARQEIEPYAERVSDAPLLAQLPEPGHVVEERRHEAVNVTEWTLSNGARVLLKPTDFSPDYLLVRGFSPGGLSLAGDSNFVSARLATEMLGVSGLGDYDRSELGYLVSGRAIGRVGATIGDAGEEIYAYGSAGETELLLQLLHLQFTAPRIDSAAVAAWKVRAKVNLGQNQIAPAGLIAQVLSQGHPRTRPLSAGMIDSADAERALAFFRERFADAGDFTFLVIGAFTPEEIRPLVERYLASLPALGRREQVRDVGIRRPKGVVRTMIPLLGEPKGETYLYFDAPFRLSRADVHLLESLGSVLQLRLTERLREELGGTYGVSVRPSIAREEEPRARLEIAFGSAPERADELAAALFEVIEDLRDHGPTKRELEEVAEMQRRGVETGIRQNDYWARTLQWYTEAGWPLDQAIVAPGRDRRELTVKSVRDAARRYLNLDNYVRITFMPKNGASRPVQAAASEAS